MTAGADNSASAGPSDAMSRALRAFPLFVMAAVTAIELALADRKYGIFTGGFGQSRAVDSAADLAWFFSGYFVAQALIGLAGWWLATRLARSRPAWAVCFLFALINGALFLAILAAQYQLASFFSDAVGFALLKQLGGGSLADALLFGLSEIGMALLALAVLALAAFVLWRAARRVFPADMPAARPSRGRWLVIAAALFAGLSWTANRSGTDAPFGLARMLGWSAANGALNTLSDVDRDGYGLFAVQHDAAPLDDTRHPLALDIPGNGVDEDGYGGDLVLVPLSSPQGPQRLAGTRTNLIIVVLESTRGDVLGKRIGGKVVAPNLEALAQTGDVARPVYSHVGFTTESLKSLFSGQLAPRRGDASLFTDLDASGYRIGVFSGQPEDFGDIAATVAMRSAADVFVDAEALREKRAFEFAAKGSLLVDESHLLSAFDAALGGIAWEQPHFLYFNFQSAHFPYFHEGVAPRLVAEPLDRAEISAERAQEVAATYWNAVAHADATLGTLIARLKAQGVWDNTLLLVTGDHGEDLFEGGFLGHGHIINTRQFATLLVANRPGVLPDGPIGLSDIRAIALAALRGKTPEVPTVPPFLHIGSLDAPTAIGLSGPNGALTSLRLDTGLACFVEANRCAPYEDLTGKDRQRADVAIARWGSERWREHSRR
ncbi:sulfatase-like hydrolase/transferase [Qipengyuania marisflavi]|uniref:Sulfatase N-terminal domain-containing protein n=1 Tax=Qipengyuania marisflavi TaxID=2486356 RepID=A0A5S3P4X8_9SPHN|nr:sulfatase-like hydrolase/transferase [Qipengyuania marisflavi]TMM48092.1 hypothetical protein FEV51_07245 [Qipengyuania marisflavi]